MLIPSIDLQAGRIVQLVQGEKLAIETDDVGGWVSRFSTFTKVQLIDLDAAKSAGDNDALVRRICAELPCRVGGGLRTIERARQLFDAGASHVIVGSALFAGDQVNEEFAGNLAQTFGADRLIAAVDSRGGRIAVNGWRTTLSLSPEEAVGRLEPWFSEFLYTHIDREGLMQGTDIPAILRVKAATTRRVTAAGGISSWDEINALDAAGVDAVVGMALYAGKLA